MRKKIVLFISFILVFAFLPLTLPLKQVYADEITQQLAKYEDITYEIFGDIKIEATEYLYGMDDSRDFVLVDFTNHGYVIYNTEMMEILEYSLNGNSPYEDIVGKKYYAGPSYYFIKEGDGYIDLSNEEYFKFNKSAFN